MSHVPDGHPLSPQPCPFTLCAAAQGCQDHGQGHHLRSDCLICVSQGNVESGDAVDGDAALKPGGPKSLARISRPFLLWPLSAFVVRPQASKPLQPSDEPVQPITHSSFYFLVAIGGYSSLGNGRLLGHHVWVVDEERIRWANHHAAQARSSVHPISWAITPHTMPRNPTDVPSYILGGLEGPDWVIFVANFCESACLWAVICCR